MHPSPSHHRFEGGNTLATLAARWTLRILVNLGGHQRLDNLLAGTSSVLATAGLDELARRDLSPRQWQARFRSRQQQIESQPFRLPTVLQNNLRLLKQQLGLNSHEALLLGFTAILHQSEGLDDSADTLGNLDNLRLLRVLAVILDQPADTIRAALSPHGVLARSGLLRIEPDTQYLTRKLLLPDNLAPRLFTEHDSIHALLDAYFSPAKHSQLAYRDFSHLGADLALLLRYLRGAMKRRLPGVNVLLYGPPGTGKTELARVLAQKLGWSLYEINMMSDDGAPLTGPKRFTAYQLGQQVLKRQPGCVLLFDEIEDVFPSGGANDTPTSKAWVNRLLEDNPVPALWISNQIDQIDRAYLRRFDCLLQVDIPPRRIRERMLRRQLGALGVSRPMIRRLANEPGLSPAVIARSARVVATAQCGRSDTKQDLQRVLSHTLTALGQPLQAASAQPGLPYRLDLVNTTTPLAPLIKGLRKRPQGRLCLYGPPGSGKSAFGRYLADALDKPLCQASASDLLDPFLGMTEKNTASLFKRAAADEAVLLIDEVDTFLRARSADDRSWETSQVNEWLTRLETFEGILVVTTNRIEQLDPAALRRFDLQLGFDYLSASQAWKLLMETMKQLGLERRDDEVLKKRLAKCGHLTAGDFAALQRRQRLLGKPADAARLVDALAEATRYRQDRPGPGIGFLSSLQ